MVKCRNKDLLASRGVKLGLLAHMCRTRIVAICKCSPLKGIIHAKLIFHPLITHPFVDNRVWWRKEFHPLDPDSSHKLQQEKEKVTRAYIRKMMNSKRIKYQFWVNYPLEVQDIMIWNNIKFAKIWESSNSPGKIWKCLMVLHTLHFTLKSPRRGVTNIFCLQSIRL